MVIQNLIKKIVALDVLIVEDEEDIADLIADILKNAGFHPRIASGSKQAFIEMQVRVPNAIILDLWLKGSDLDGLGILEKIKSNYPLLPVVVISGHGTIDTAISAIKMGAYDYIAKPLSQEKLLITLKRACEASRLRKENIGLKSKLKKENELIGQSGFVSKLRSDVEKIAASNSRVLIKAPFGCEQNVVANIVHSKSFRSARQMITVNPYLIDPCKIQESLFGNFQRNDRDLFRRKISLLEAAHGSTLYLQDVTLLSLEVQKQLLKFIQNSKLPQSDDELDVRIIASSSPDIENLVKNGNFLADLYERLNIIQITIPALCQRREDIGVLAKYYLSQITSAYGLKKISFTDEVIAILESFEWKANLKELSHVVEYAFCIAQSTYADCISPDMLGILRNKGSQDQEFSNEGVDIVGMNFREAKSNFERYYLTLQMHRFSNNISKTSDFIQMERSALHRKLKSLNLSVKD
jgi:two-component system nitrogen regulation response regulator NtrX